MSWSIQYKGFMLKANQQRVVPTPQVAMYFLGILRKGSQNVSTAGEKCRRNRLSCSFESLKTKYETRWEEESEDDDNQCVSHMSIAVEHETSEWTLIRWSPTTKRSYANAKMFCQKSSLSTTKSRKPWTTGRTASLISRAIMMTNSLEALLKALSTYKYKWSRGYLIRLTLFLCLVFYPYLTWSAKQMVYPRGPTYGFSISFEALRRSCTKCSKCIQLEFS